MSTLLIFSIPMWVMDTKQLVAQLESLSLSVRIERKSLLQRELIITCSEDITPQTAFEIGTLIGTLTHPE